MKHTTQYSKLLNKIISISTILFIVTASGYLIRYFLQQNKLEQTNDAQVESYLNPVTARAGGFIAKVYFEENQLVKQGDTLLIIDNSEYNIKVSEAQAALDDANAQLIVLRASINASKAATTVNADQIESARAKLWQQEQDMKRFKNLMNEEAVTGQEYEQVKARYEVANSEFNASQHSLTTGYSRVKEIASREALLQADIKRKTAQLNYALLNLSYTVIRAPYSGRLGKRSIYEGLQIQPGQPLVTIINEDKKWVIANFKETQVGDMKVGETVTIKVDALPNAVYHGVIESMSGATGAKFSLLSPDNSTGNFVKITQRIPIKIRFTDKDIAAVKAGMNVNVSIKKAIE